MHYRVLPFLFVLFASMQQALGAVVRVADGDCADLSAAAASAPGSEPSLIVLANKGRYALCQLVVSGNISIDGAGAEMALASQTNTYFQSQVQVLKGGSLTLRNINLGSPSTDTAAVSRAQPAVAALVAGAPASPSQIFVSNAAIANLGTLTLDAVSVSGIQYASSGTLFEAMIVNAGALFMRNVSVSANSGNQSLIEMLDGSADIVHSTFAANSTGAYGILSAVSTGAITVANSVLMNDASPICTAATVESPQGRIVSRGGNVTSDASCAFSSSGDRVFADAGLGAFGDNGGLVSTVLLNGSSIAVHNGVAANCEASDARGVTRNVAARGGCDSGAYEFGGGRGLLPQGGMSGFFYDASADGHYVTVQRLDWGSTLVIWNTFDKNGQAAWIYAIGEANGKHIHAQGAQNLGGVLQPGGAPTGSHGIVWGDIDIDLQNCFGGTFSYNSPLPNFGSGQFPLNRLAFLGDLDCSD